MPTTQAALTDGQGRFYLADLAVADPAPDEVLVRLRATSVCHTDYDSLRWGEPLVLGHEGAGEVVAVGAAVAQRHPGQRVLLNWAMPCGDCLQCHLGHEHLCERQSPVTGPQGFNAGHAHPAGTQHAGHPIRRSFNLGTLSGYTLVKAAATTPLPATLPWASACLLGCGVMTGVGSVTNAARVRPGSRVAVLGVGGVGLNVVQGARLAGARQIIALDLSAERLALSGRFGATHQVLVSPADTDLAGAIAQVKALTDGRGADYAFECTGNPRLGAAPLALIRHAGTAVQVSGIEQEISIDMRLFEWDKLYLNPLYGQCRPSIDFPILFDLYQSGQLLLDELVSRTYALAELGQVFDDMLHGRIAKGVILFND